MSNFTWMRIIVRHFRGVSAMQLPCIGRGAVMGPETREASWSWMLSRGPSWLHSVTLIGRGESLGSAQRPLSGQ